MAAIDIKEAVERAIISIPGVTGIGLGHSSPEKIHVYVKSMCQNIVGRIPDQIGGVPVQIIVTGTITSLQQMAPLQLLPQRTDRWNSIPGGVSIGHYKVTAGTHGVKCYDASTGEVLGLSNNHVLANENDSQIGDAIIQPGVYDMGDPVQDRRGTLDRSIHLNFQGENELDCSAWKPDNPDELDDSILDIGKVTEMGEPEIGNVILKSGRTSALNEGEIVDISASIKVNYSRYHGVIFKNQIIITPGIGFGGDSGSLIVRKSDKKAVGLLFAGSDSITVANRMSTVAQALNVNLSGIPGHLTPPAVVPTGGSWGTVAVLASMPLIFGIVKRKNGGRR